MAPTHLMNAFALSPLGWQEPLLRLVAAVVVGAGLGLDREIHAKPAGLRTHALVALGAALVTVLSVQVAGSGGTFDGSAVLRTTQGVLTGIGFLGAGVILHSRSGSWVHGLTTAASIWVVASLGIACGLGQFWLALGALVLALAVLNLGGPVERAVHRLLQRGNQSGPSALE